MPYSLGELDLHLIGEGSHRRLWEVLGANIAQLDGVDGATFGVWAPNARALSVVGDWNDWHADVDRLEPQGVSGVWAGFAPGARVGACYKFVVDGPDGNRSYLADPLARRAELPPSNASVIAGPRHHAWADDEWLARRATGVAFSQALRIYEVHAGSWRPNLGWHELAHQLADYVVDLGFTHVELMPIAEHPFAPSWGYQITSYYAPTARFGTPDDFRYFVDHLHQRGIGVILDWVPAHFPKDDWALARFDGTALYEHADPRQGEHPDWGTYIFNYGRDEVRNFLVANALYWIEEFHVDGLRVDAVASMLYLDYSREDDEWVPNQHGGRENLEAIGFLQDLNTVVHGAHKGVVTIAEESTSWPGVSQPVHVGGLGFSHKWNMGWMHDTLTYLGRDPAHRKYHHNELTFGLLYAFTETFVLPLSHDEVVHGKGSLIDKMAGDDWQKFATLRALLGWMWAYPGSKMLFMGSEIAQYSEWNMDHGVDWDALHGERHRGVQNLVREINRGAESLPALANVGGADSFTWLDADDADHSVYGFVRRSLHGEVLCIANFTPVPIDRYRVGLPRSGCWTTVMNTDSGHFGGSSFEVPAVTDAHSEPWQGQEYSGFINLAPLAVHWLAQTS